MYRFWSDFHFVLSLSLTKYGVLQLKSIYLGLIALALLLATNIKGQDSTRSFEVGINALIFHRMTAVGEKPVVFLNTPLMPLTRAIARMRQNGKIYIGRINYFQLDFDGIAPTSIDTCISCFRTSGSWNNLNFGLGQQFYFKKSLQRVKPYWGADIGFSYLSYRATSEELGGVLTVKTATNSYGLYGNIFAGLELQLLERVFLLMEINTHLGFYIHQTESNDLMTSELQKNWVSQLIQQPFTAHNLLTLTYKIK